MFSNQVANAILWETVTGFVSNAKDRKARIDR